MKISLKYFTLNDLFALVSDGRTEREENDYGIKCRQWDLRLCGSSIFPWERPANMQQKVVLNVGWSLTRGILNFTGIVVAAFSLSHEVVSN